MANKEFKIIKKSGEINEYDEYDYWKVRKLCH